MDLFDLGEGFSSLLEGVARIQCPTLVSIAMRTRIATSITRILEPTILNILQRSISVISLSQFNYDVVRN